MNTRIKSPRFFTFAVSALVVSSLLLAGCQQSMYSAAEANMQMRLDALKVRVDVLSDLITLMAADCELASKTGLDTKIKTALEDVKKSTTDLQITLDAEGTGDATGAAGLPGSVNIPGSVGVPATVNIPGSVSTPGLPNLPNPNLDVTGGVEGDAAGTTSAGGSATIPSVTTPSTTLPVQIGVPQL